MNYTLISEYIDAIRLAEDNFNKLSNLRPVLDGNGNPIMSSGNFAVVFKMKDINDGRYYATAVPFRNHRCQKGSDIALRHSFLLGQFC